MAKLNKQKRDKISDDKFAFPKEEKEPLNDAAHVRNAIARFNQVEGVTDTERDAAWERIRSAAKNSVSRCRKPVGASCRTAASGHRRRGRKVCGYLSVFEASAKIVFDMLLTTFDSLRAVS